MINITHFTPSQIIAATFLLVGFAILLFFYGFFRVLRYLTEKEMYIQMQEELKGWKNSSEYWRNRFYELKSDQTNE